MLWPSCSKSPERPFAAILGGAKVSDKIGVIDHLLSLVDQCSSVAGWRTPSARAGQGKSLAEPDRVEDARRLLATAAKNDVRVLVDVIVAKEVTCGPSTRRSRPRSTLCSRCTSSTSARRARI